MLSRKDFSRLVKKLLPTSGLSAAILPELITAAKGKARPPVMWLETNTCTGDILSLLNSLDPGLRGIITDLIDLRYDNLLMAAEGDMAMAVLDDMMERSSGEYILAVEGTIPTGANGRFSVIGRRQGKMWTSLEAVRELAKGARHVVAMGTCAAFGGPYAAAPNPTGGRPVPEVIDKPVINVPGCPAHPDWMIGTLAHLIWYGEPELDARRRPTLFYGETIHNLCQRRHYFDSGIFAQNPGEPWCMYRIGCKGPVTFADCPYREWNGEHLSWPVKANTPCIGCTSPEFPDGTAPFFEHLPDVALPGITVNANRVGVVTAALTALGIGSHLAGSVLTGRLSRAYGKQPGSVLGRVFRRKK
ncbi:hyaluronate lyase [Clostridiales bacterium PH28_bin88]|nr:hyaluronate lyase [Clostridiales bacterium PH28_bin88]